MTWWAWTMLWVVLVALGGLVLYVAVRRLLRQGMALVRELGAAADAFAEVTMALEAGADSDPGVAADATSRRRRTDPRGGP